MADANCSDAAMGQFGSPVVVRVLIGTGVGPFAKCSLDEALSFPLVFGVYGLVKI